LLYKNVDNQSSINFGLSTFFYYLFDIKEYKFKLFKKYNPPISKTKLNYYF